MTVQANIVASGILAFAAGWFSWTLLSLFRSRPVAIAKSSKLDEERRDRLCAANSTYQNFQPLVRELAALNGYFADIGKRESLGHSLRLAVPSVPWEPFEFTACKQIEGLIAAAIVAIISLMIVGVWMAIAIGVAVATLYVYSSVQGVKRAAADKVKAVKRRLPFAIDLIALMLEAGASFQEALKTALRENASHPLGEELDVVVRQVELGRPRRLALESLRSRLEDQDITDLVMGINKGEELGTPLGTIMRTQSDQMRLKRAQWGEKAAAEAQVRMTFPAMLVMLACMLLILAPFLLLPLLQMF